MARHRQPPATASNAALVAAASHSFAHDGLAGSSLNQILTKAGWAKSSFYHYFTSKAQLHDHVVSALTARLTDGVQVPDPASLTAENFWGSIERVLSELASAAHRAPETRQLGLMFHQDTSVGPDSTLATVRMTTATWITAVVERGATLGLVRNDLPVTLATQLVLQVATTIDRFAVDHELHSPGGIGEPALAISLLRGLVDAPR